MLEKEKAKNWYKDFHNILKEKYPQDYILISSLIASTSARNHIKRNIITAMAIYKDFKVNQLTFDYIINYKYDFLKKYKLMNCHYNNIIKSFNGDKNLNGLKVNSFFHNLKGDFNYITIDIWIIRYFNFKSKFNQLSLREYTYLSNKIRYNAKKLNMLPCEYQAYVWSKYRDKIGLNYKDFTMFLN